MNKKNIFAFIVVIIFFLVGFFLIFKYKNNPSLALPLSGEGLGEVSPPDKGDLGGYSNIKYVEIGGQKIQVDLALTEAEQAQGLSGRLSLSPSTGMLFVFSEPGKPLFWMKDMNFSIDMIWLAPSEGGDISKTKVDYIEKNATPESYPITYGPGANDGMAEYVLETTAGFSDKNNLKVGDSVQFTY